VITGLLLAAGAGRRMGRPKALLRDPDGTPFLHRAVRALLDGGSAGVTVVLGASADRARAVLAEPGLDSPVRVVVATGWEEGMGASLRAGLAALVKEDGAATAGASPTGVVVTLVDLPDVGPEVVARVLARGRGAGRAALVRSTYGGVPGHPVLLGREHWGGVAATAEGDQGARSYFREHPPVPCECGDLATGHDVDRPEDLGR
jgi:CTP:molybdopterin cytidylyltransferase MocA